MGADRAPALSPDGQRRGLPRLRRAFSFARSTVPRGASWRGRPAHLFLLVAGQPADSVRLRWPCLAHVGRLGKARAARPCAEGSRRIGARGLDGETANSFWSAAISPACSPCRRVAERGRRSLRWTRRKKPTSMKWRSCPIGRGLIFTVHRLAHGPDTIAVFAGGNRRTVLQLPGEGLRSPVYSAPGFLMFRRDAGQLWTVGDQVLSGHADDGRRALHGRAGRQLSDDWFRRHGGVHPRAGAAAGTVWRSRDGAVERIGSLPAAVKRIAGPSDVPAVTGRTARCDSASVSATQTLEL